MDQRWGWDITFINVVRCKVININLRPNWNKPICKCLVNWKKYIFSAAAIVEEARGCHGHGNFQDDFL